MSHNTSTVKTCLNHKPAHPHCLNKLPSETHYLRAFQDIESAKREMRRPISSRSASLHRPVVKRDRADEGTTTQDDMATVVSKGSSPSSSRCQSAVDPSMLASSTTSLSKSRKEERSSRSSRRSSRSGSSRNLVRKVSARCWLANLPPYFWMCNSFL